MEFNDCFLYFKNTFSLDLGQVHTVALTGSEKSQAVVEGLIVKTMAEQMILINKSQLREKACLVSEWFKFCTAFKIL